MLQVVNIGFKSFILLVLFILTYQYLPTKIYDYPAPETFKGTQFFNPYTNLNSNWLKGNFHAHAYAWSGLTHGHQSGEVIQEVYKKLGYDVPVVTDYYRINPDADKTEALYIPAYEHGTDIKKTHRQIIGAEKVDFYDITFQFNTHQKQYLIERLKNTTAVLAVNHPGLRKGHPDDVLEKVSGYDCLEVFNKSTDYSAYWDAALSAGKAAWIIANDDTHDVLKENNSVGTAWTMLNVEEKTADAVLLALANGKSYGVQLRNDLPKEIHKKNRGMNENAFQFIEVEKGVFKIKLEKSAEHIRLIGQNGRTKKYCENSDYIEYLLGEEDTYIRAEILNKHTKILLNPIIRYDGINTPTNALTSKTHWGYTLLFRLGIILLDFIFIMILVVNPIVGKEKKKRKNISLT